MTTVFKPSIYTARKLKATEYVPSGVLSASHAGLSNSAQIKAWADHILIKKQFL